MAPGAALTNQRRCREEDAFVRHVKQRPAGSAIPQLEALLDPLQAYLQAVETPGLSGEITVHHGDRLLDTRKPFLDGRQAVIYIAHIT
jgi:hypothetical protein